MVRANGWVGFFVLGTVFLVVTGGEAPSITSELLREAVTRKFALGIVRLRCCGIEFVQRLQQRRLTRLIAPDECGDTLNRDPATVVDVAKVPYSEI